MKREVDVERARIAWNFLQLPYVTRAALLNEFNLHVGEPHEKVLSEVLDRLDSEERLEEFGERVNELRGGGTAKMGMIQPGRTMDDLPKVRECIPVAKSESDAILLAFSKKSPVVCLDTENETGGVCGLFVNTQGARAERGEVPAEIVAAGERMDELRKAAKPLRAYLMKYGDPYTVVVVRQDCATETQEGCYVTFEGVQ